MEAYGLQRFLPLVDSVRQAHVDRFKIFLEENMAHLQTMRIWSLTQKLFNVVHRNVRPSWPTLLSLCFQILFKCHAFHVRQHPEQPSHQMDLHVFAAGLRVLGMKEADVMDALNIARGLIQKAMVCGYVASQRKLLVLAKNNPFPKLRNINLEAGDIFVEAE